MNKISIKKERESNFELLRILSMIFIIAHHYTVHAGFYFERTLSFNRLLVQFLSLGGKIGVNCFVLITGWFMSTQKFKPKSILLFVVQVTFFSIVINGLSFLFGYSEFSFRALWQSVFPLFYGEWWFASVYFVLILLAPFLNILLQHLDKMQHYLLVGLLFVLWCVIPTFLKVYMESNSLLWFVFLYVFASVARKWQDKWFSNLKLAIIVFVIAIACLILSVIASDILGKTIDKYYNQATAYAEMQMLPCVISSIALFFIFKNIKIKSSKAINTLSGSMFGVYLLHDSRVLRKYLWVDFLKNTAYANSRFLIVHALLSITIVFIACTIISIIYNLTIKKLALFVYDKSEKAIKRKKVEHSQPSIDKL